MGLKQILCEACPGNDDGVSAMVFLPPKSTLIRSIQDADGLRKLLRQAPDWDSLSEAILVAEATKPMSTKSLEVLPFIGDGHLDKNFVAHLWYLATDEQAQLTSSPHRRTFNGESGSAQGPHRNTSQVHAVGSAYDQHAVPIQPQGALAIWGNVWTVAYKQRHANG